MPIGSTTIKQICLVTWDLAQAERNWSAVLGIEPQHLKTPLWADVPSYTHDRPDTFVAQAFLVYTLSDGMVLEIFGPGSDDQPNPWRDYLEAHGEGIMNLAFFVPDRKEAYNAIGQACGVDKPYHEGFYPSGCYTFVDTTAALGVELNIKNQEDNTAQIAALVAAPDSYTR